MTPFVQRCSLEQRGRGERRIKTSRQTIRDATTRTATKKWRMPMHSTLLAYKLPPSSFEPPRSSTPAVIQTQLSPPRISTQDSLDKRISIHASQSTETILMTPSSLGQDLGLKPTTSRQSVTPSVNSQTGKRNFLDRFRRTSTPAPVSAQQYQVWHPNASTSTPEGSPARRMKSDPRELDKITPPPTPPTTKAPISISIPIEEPNTLPMAHVFNPFNYLTRRKNFPVDVASLEARDGTAVSWIS